MFNKLLRRHLTTTTTPVSRLQLSTNQLLPPAALMVGCAFLNSEQEAYNVVKTALNAGITDFDTAPLYNQGKSEHYLGAAVAKLPPHEVERVRIFTKCGRLLSKGTEQVHTVTNDYTNVGVVQSLEQSMSRLGRRASAQIYGLRIHDPNDSIERPVDTDEVGVALGEGGAVEALLQMRKNGTIPSIGIGMNTNVETTIDSTSPVGNLPPSLTDGVPAQVVRMLEGMPTDVDPYDEVLLAGGWTLLTQTGLAALLTAQHQHIPVSAAGIFSTGLLVGNEQYAYQRAPREKVEQTQCWQALAAEYSIPLPTLAIGFAYLPKCVSRVVVGCGNEKELAMNIEGAESSSGIPKEVWDEAFNRGLLGRGLHEHIEFV